MNFTIKGFNDGVYKDFKVLCARLSVSIKEGIAQAIKLFIDKHEGK